MCNPKYGNAQMRPSNRKNRIIFENAKTSQSKEK
jgi:hypothetical protein